MTLFVVVVFASIAVMLARGWKSWPQRLAPAHEAFRSHGRADLYRRAWPSSRLTTTGVTLHASEVEFERTATFTLLPPMLSSAGLAQTSEGRSVRIHAITRYPTLRSYFIIENPK